MTDCVCWLFRLFTAADSDDICIAAQFIARLRPWSTLMGVGWGYGANMLTKYLGEASETTPLTAAVSIGNPFDLDEATRSLSHYSVLDRKIVEGLKNILRCNKVCALVKCSHISKGLIVTIFLLLFLEEE
jgi:predicted alpha/beta-fold hydrolase